MTSEDISPWDVLVLATLAPLGAFRPVHLTPNLGPAELGVAASAPIPRAPGEFLVAAISDSSEAAAIPVLLTTRRIIWFERIAPATGAVDRRPTLGGRAADFSDVGPEAAAVGSTVDLGAGRVVPLPPDQPRLAEALAEAIRTLRHAATTGEAPAVAPALAARIAAAIPRARALDARLADVGAERSRFRQELMAGSPRVYATPAIVAACVAVWGAMTLAGVAPGQPTSEDLLAWGANNALRVALGGEAWRLPASVFLHGGILHLAVNMWALAVLGPLVERLYGTARFATLYMVAGVGGAMASSAIGPARVSVGASGAIFGVLGAILSFLIIHRHAIPPSILKPLRSQTLTFVVFNVAFGAIVPAIDQAAHLGGLAAGFLAGLALWPPWPPLRTSAAARARTVVACAAVAAATVVACAWAIDRRAETISPADLFRDFALQIAPIEDVQDDTAKGLMDIAREFAQTDGRTIKADLAARLDDQEREGRANLEALKAVWTPDPKLRAFADLMADFQREQIAAVEAARRYARAGDRHDLEGDGGFTSHVQAAARIRASTGGFQESYLRDRGMTDEDDEP